MSSKNSQNVLVLGGAGFIGKSVCLNLINNGHFVRILDNLSSQVHGALPDQLDWISDHRIDFIRGSISDKHILLKSLQGIDTIIHLAAETGTGQSMYQIEHYNAVNSQSTAVLMDILVNSVGLNVQRVILASSRSVYGEGSYSSPDESINDTIYPRSRSLVDLQNHRWDPICPFTNLPLIPKPTLETDKINPISIYASTKYAQEDLVRITCQSINIDYVILRLQNVYGEGQSLSNPYTGILSIFSTRIRRGLTLPVFEDGRETRDFVHISDVTRAFIAAVENCESISSVINVGSGVASSIYTVASKLVSVFESDNKIEITSNFRLGDIRHNFADINRLQSILKVSPSITLDVGLSKFVNWVKLQALPLDMLDTANEELRSRRLMH